MSGHENVMIILARVSVAVKQRNFFYLRIRDFKITPQKAYLAQRFAQINGRTTKICLSFNICEWTAWTKLKILLLRALPSSEIEQDFFHLCDLKVISLKATVLLAFSRFLV